MVQPVKAREHWRTSSSVVVADPHREQFQYLATVVLVYCVLMVVLVVQPENHGGVARDMHEEIAEAAEPVPAEHLDLLQDGFRAG